jgi:hypothetical protein
MASPTAENLRTVEVSVLVNRLEHPFKSSLSQQMSPEHRQLSFALVTSVTQVPMLNHEIVKEGNHSKFVASPLKKFAFDCLF